MSEHVYLVSRFNNQADMIKIKSPSMSLGLFIDDSLLFNQL
ncbi:hypothetical protein AOT82_1632 [Psychrobacter sp. AntiMn-1]|nr:hypothetical protein AOT82_1632 [Psychrobacter sp. AntiMn-1]